jgi:hypothetical protein
MRGFTYDYDKKAQVPTCSRIIAMTDCSDGNESVGSMWREAASFPIEAPIIDILAWVQKVDGSNLTITLDLSTEKPL